MQTTSLPAGRRARVTPLATILESQRIGAPAFSAWRARVGEARRHDDVARDLGHAAGMDDAHRDRLLGRVKRARSASARMMAKERR